ncbi:MAG TPA: phospholipid carrier-dependent glycosyltransferase [Candidatus Peribacteraceae bacterium]|nr:phospholipid carrier-dependent glycosyltransferase [Candidatus Peribacteraceae bacterium]
MIFSAQKSRSSLYIWLVALAIFLVKAMFLATASARGLAMTSWIIDDSFIEMRVARNIALGLGFTYDHVHPTTGSPFFWTYLMSLNHLLFSKDWAVKMTLIDSTFFAAIATVLVFFIAHRISGSKMTAWIAFILAAFSGNSFIEAMNGMDTGIFTFLIMLTVALSLGIGRRASWSDFRWGMVIGLAGGVTLLTRFDGTFIIAAIGIVQLLNWKKAAGKSTKLAWRNMFAGMVLVAGICFIADVIWNKLNAGTWSPGNQVGRQELAFALHNFSYAHFHLGQWLHIVIWNLFQLRDLMDVAIGSAMLCIFALAWGLLKKETRIFSAITAMYIFIFFGLLAAYQWYFPDFHGLRYVNPAVHLLCISIALLFMDMPQYAWKKATAILLTILTLILSWYGVYNLLLQMPWAKGMIMNAHPTAQQEKNFWETIDWMHDHLPQDTIVGVRDHGRVAYFSDLPIQDLAGDIDPAVAEHVKDGTLAAYLKSRNVQYLLIPDLSQRQDSVYQEIYKTMHLQQVPDAPVAPSQNTRLYKILWE